MLTSFSRFSPVGTFFYTVGFCARFLHGLSVEFHPPPGSVWFYSLLLLVEKFLTLHSSEVDDSFLVLSLELLGVPAVVA